MSAVWRGLNAAWYFFDLRAKRRPYTCAFQGGHDCSYRLCGSYGLLLRNYYSAALRRLFLPPLTFGTRGQYDRRRGTCRKRAKGAGPWAGMGPHGPGATRLRPLGASNGDAVMEYLIGAGLRRRAPRFCSLLDNVHYPVCSGDRHAQSSPLEKSQIEPGLRVRPRSHACRPGSPWRH
jgi:hypothetical protein